MAEALLLIQKLRYAEIPERKENLVYNDIFGRENLFII